MPTIAEKIRFASTYVTNKEGARWSIEGREWVRDQYWLPADGYKLWRAGSGGECDDCKLEIGTLIEHPFDNPTRSPEHRRTGCPGLDVYPVLVTLLNLKRQDGKTFNGMAHDLADLAMGKNISIAFMAASEKQAEALLDENYGAAIRGNEKLSKRFDVQRMRIVCRKTNSFIEAVATAKKSTTGRSRRRIRIDEARDVPDTEAWSMIPGIQAMSGIECPAGHVSHIDKDAAMSLLRGERPKTCTACGERLQPFFGRFIAASSSGPIEEDAAPWFHDLVQQRREEPSPYVHLFDSDETLNPAKNELVIDAITEIFGGLESMRADVESDLTNRWTHKNKPFLSKSEIEHRFDPALSPLDECALPAVAFLDASRTREKTALVILCQDPQSQTPWERLFTARIDWWVPSEFKGGIDERVVQPHLERVLPLFTGLDKLHVDTRGMLWPKTLVKNLKALGLKVEAWDKNTDHEEDAGWTEFQKRVNAETITMLEAPSPVAPTRSSGRTSKQEIVKEITGVHVKFVKEAPRVVDKNRRKSHKDITQCIAICCYLVALKILGKRRGIGTAAARTIALEALKARHTTRGQILTSELSRGEESY